MSHIQIAFAASDWLLRTSSAGPDAAQEFCMATQTLNDGRTLAIARNLIGQYSLVLGLNGAVAPPGQTVRVALAAGDVQRVMTGLVQKDKTITVPLGWNDSLIRALALHNKLAVRLDDKADNLSLAGSALALSRLASCANSLLERNPGLEALPAAIRQVLEQAGMKDIRLVQTGGASSAPDRKRWTWMYHGVFGGVDDIPAAKESTLDNTVLNYTDGLEKLCRGGAFKSNMGAPEKLDRDQSAADLDIECRKGNDVSFSSLVFIQRGDVIQAYFTEANETLRAEALAQKNALLRIIKIVK